MSVTCLLHSRCAFNFSSAVKVTCMTELTALNNRAWFCCSITNLWSLKFMMQGLKKSICGVSLPWKSEMPLRTLSCLSPKGPLFHSHPQVEGETSPLFSFWQGQLKCSRALMTPGAAAVKRNAQTIECTHWNHEVIVRSAIFSGPTAINWSIATVFQGQQDCLFLPAELCGRWVSVGWIPI